MLFSFVFCQNKATIRCQNGYKLRIINTWYGRPSPETNICPGRDSYKTCPVIWNSNTEVAACNGRQSCSFAVTNGANGRDPCDGIFKIQAIHAGCEPAGFLALLSSDLSNFLFFFFCFFFLNTQQTHE